ncbi:ABC transporter ATP-binding protein [Gemmobacter lanyuensis]
MAATDCAHLAPALAEHLSGGERQRAFIAMALAQEAPLLLLDEPTAALDLAHAHEVMALLRRLADQEGRAVVVVLHDVNLAARFADRIVALKGGQLALTGRPPICCSPRGSRRFMTSPCRCCPCPGACPRPWWPERRHR